MKDRGKKILCFITILLILMLPACSAMGEQAEPDTIVPAIRVLITDINCPSLEVQAGIPVVWTNRGGQVYVVQSAPVADGSRLFDSGELKVGDSFSFTFPEPGSYSYQCSPDGKSAGIITVMP
jgi:plastocyanin